MKQNTLIDNIQGKSQLTKHQVDTKTKNFKEGCKAYRIIANIRYDDECGNGHNSFAITGEIWRQGNQRDCESCGCIHDEIAKHFPELKPYLKWHLMNSDGPMHYVANTIYHVSDTDYNGLKDGEFNSFTYQVVIDSGDVLFKSKIFYSFRNWLHHDEAKEQAETYLNYIKPELNPKIVRIGSGEPSKGKPSDLEAARNSAIWTDATLEQLQDEKQLKERLPALIQEFRKDVEALGFVF